MSAQKWMQVLCVVSLVMLAAALGAQEPAQQTPAQPEATTPAAQPAPATAEQARRAIEEITVTARKTEERLEDVPLTIRAFTSENMAELGLTSVEGVADATPGLHIANYQGIRDDPGLRFRGMAPGTLSRFRQNASAFVDGVYLPGSSQSVTLADVARTEVVKGPQSAFFGRQTFGGAINFITKSPTFDWAGDFNASFGEHNRQDIDVGVGGPISEQVAFRIFGRFFNYDGAYDNGFPEGRTLGEQSTAAGSASLLFNPNDSSRVSFRLAYSQDDDGPSAVAFFPSSVLNCGPFGGTSRYFCGELTNDLANPLGYNTTVDPDIPGSNWPKSDYGLKREFMLATLNIDLMFDDLNFTSQTSYLTEKVENMDEFTGTSTLLWYYKNEDTLFSEEARLQGSSDKLDWMVGLYYLDADYEDLGNGFGCSGPQWLVFGRIPGCAFFGWPPIRGYFDLTASPKRNIKNTALFGSMTYHVNPNLSLSLEGRAAQEKLDFGEILGDGDGSLHPLRNTFDSFTPRFIVDYKPNDDSTLYLNLARGNKAGGFNTDMADMADSSIEAFQAQYGVGLAIPEEEIWNYELGWKSVLGGGRHAFNIAAYYMDWTNQGFRNFAQGVDTNGDGVYVADEDEFQIDYDATAGKSRIIGIEMFYNGRLGEFFDLLFTYNYNDAEYEVFEDANMQAVFGDPDASGQKQPLSPQHSATLGIGFDHPAWSDWDVYARADTTYIGSSYTWVLNLAETGEAVRTNLRTGLRNDRYDVSIFVNNVTDDDTFMAIRRFTDFNTLGQAFWAGLPLPREFGATVRVRF